MVTQVLDVRAATRDDLDVLAGLVAQFRDGLGRNEPADDALGRHICRLLNDPTADFLVAWDEEAPAGYLLQRSRFSLWLGAPEVTLEDLFVTAAGRRRGVATALVEAAIAIARDRGAKELRLDTNAANVEAVGLYTRLGFTSGSAHAGSGSPQLAFRLEL